MSKQWEVVHLKQGDLQLDILPRVGGRLWDIKLSGRSLLFQNTELVGKTINISSLLELPTRSPQFNFPLWGGEKTWIAPDSSWINGAPFPALDSGIYDVRSQDDHHILLESQQCPISNLTIKRRITLSTESEWFVEHIVTNGGAVSRKTGIWSVMMINTPTAIGAVMSSPGFHHVFGDPADSIMKSPVGMLAQCTKMQEFKIGLQNPDGKTLIKFGKGGPWLTCTVPVENPECTYAHNHPFEIFSSGDYPYCEAEWHSPMKELEPGDSLNFRQVFNIWEDGASNEPAILTAQNKELMSCMS